MGTTHHDEASGRSEVDSLSGRLARIRNDIREATRAAGRINEPELIVVTKFHPASLIRDLHELGERNFGESRHPEARDKVAELEALDGVTWHFIGQIQSKKARQIARYVDVIHSIDRIALVDALAPLADERENPIGAFAQLNLTSDDGRGGTSEDELLQLAEAINESPILTLRGVMAIAPLDESPERAFDRVVRASERLETRFPGASERSMGMSGDFQAAIERGATHLRIGTAITGKRPLAT